MDVESHATPTTITPQQRYAALHRALERGLVSDAIWKELAEVSHALGHIDEAARCAREIDNRSIRMALESKLTRHPNRARAKQGPAGSLTAAPAASHAGPMRDLSRETPGNRILEAAEAEAGLRGHLIDAVQFLLHQHMPWLCLVSMLSFPIVIGLGGFLTSGTSAVALAAISALPGICVLAVVFAMGRRILLESSEGEADVPAIPEVRLLATEAALFVRDLVIVHLALVIPLGIALLLQLSVFGLVSFALLGMVAAPMAFCLRQMRGDTASLSPVLIGQAVCKGGSSYLAVAAVCWAMALPTAAVFYYVASQPVWLQIAFVGPTAVLPVFLSMRLLGTWIDANFDRVGELLGMAPRTDADAASATITMGQRPSADSPPPTVAKPQATATPSPARAPEPAPRPEPAPPRPAPQARAAAAQPARQPQPAPARPKVQRQAPAEPRPQQPARKPAPAPAPAPAPVRAIEGRRPKPPAAEEVPDLTQLPGAVTVSGHDRVRLGAASRR